MGTAAYFSPEQAQGASPDPRSDLYSLGIVMYEMVGGRPPFTGDNPVSIAYKQVHEAPPRLRDLSPDVPVAYEAIVAKLLAKDPAARYANADDLRLDLTRFRDGQRPEALVQAAAAAGAVAAAGAGAAAAATTATPQVPPAYGAAHHRRRRVPRYPGPAAATTRRSDGGAPSPAVRRAAANRMALGRHRPRPAGPRRRRLPPLPSPQGRRRTEHPDDHRDAGLGQQDP